MQRDFLLPGGFGASLGNAVSQLQRVVPPLARALRAARDAGMLVVHTREGHLPDLSDCPPAKLNRGEWIGGMIPYGQVANGIRLPDGTVSVVAKRGALPRVLREEAESRRIRIES